MFHASTSSGNGSVVALVPLRRWITVEVPKLLAGTSDDNTTQRKDAVLLHKTAVAYGIAELLKHARDYPAAEVPAAPLRPSSGGERRQRCGIDNFAVRVACSAAPAPGEPPRTDVRGVEMLSPRLSMEIVEPSFLCRGLDGGGGDDRRVDPLAGRYLEAEFPDAADDGDGAAGPLAAVSQSEEDARCRALGALLYELFSHLSLSPADGLGLGGGCGHGGGGASQGPPIKRARRRDDAQAAGENRGGAPSPSSSTFRRADFPLADLGFPSSMCLLVRNLLECGEDERPDDAYDSLETVSKDLHLLLLEPRRFLLDQPTAPSSEGRTAAPRRLSLRKHKLYGREDEVSLITDAFCRVSSGQSEAFFIGGFSGSGKSRLVGSLTARVAAAGGYVLAHKFDQGSQEQTLLEVIAVFNDLCLLIRDRGSPGSLHEIVNSLTEVFGTDLSVLALLLPNIEALAPGGRQNRGPDHHGKERERDGQMDLRSVRFTLQRFMRVVSSAARPVVLFLDDLQWCDDSTLAVIEDLLCDASGSSCCFFVGSYRSNEVDTNHAIFHLIDGLRAADVPATMLSLKGLGPADLNTMVSDALGTFPRVCEPLSDIVFQKTKGNPFFVLEFLRSLVEGGLLQYDAGKRRWVWDEDRIGAMDVTGNVLHLLSSKMSGLSESTQSALKVAACFGMIKEPVIGYLSTNAEYSDIRTGLEHVVAEGFMIKVGASDIKFVHDKMREAAYSLILNSEKNQYHYRLGMALYTTTKGSNVDDIVFSMADQINHGINDASNQSPELMLDLANLNEMAGVKAVDCYDYVTARAYLNIALSLLPADHWKSRYDQSLQLFLILAKSAYACGDMEKAQKFLHEILGECSCTEDTVQAYYLLVTILSASGKMGKAYSTCHAVLTQLGETIPQWLESKEATRMVKATSKTVQNISDADLLEMKEMDEKLSVSLKFYSLMASIAFFAKPHIFSFLACRMIALTMKHGVCKYSIMGLCQYAAVKSGSTTAKDIEEASRLGKAALSCLKKRFRSTEVVAMVPFVYYIYYGLVAYHTEPLQLCADMLGQGFDAGMSAGESAAAFINSVQQIKTSFIAGEKLSTLLEKMGYYLELTDLYKNEIMKTYLLIYHETISTLIDKGKSTSSNMNQSSSENDVKSGEHTSGTIYMHRAFQAFWLGHSERCQHYLVKVLLISSVTHGLAKIMAMFIQGLNSFQLLKRQNTVKLKAIAKNAIKVLKGAEANSEWNFRNKVHLLEAESFSYHGHQEEANASYAAAIVSARSSRFVHEQGLACELAGFHYKKIGDHRSAWGYFNQAKQCYADWGSQMKVDDITCQLRYVQIKLTAGQEIT